MSSVFRGVRLAEIVQRALHGGNYIAVMDVVYSKDALELVLKAVADDRAELPQWRAFNDRKQSSNEFLRGKSTFLHSARQVGVAMIRSGVASTDFNRPVFWVSASNEETSRFAFVGFHTLIDLEQYVRLGLVDFGEREIYQTAGDPEPATILFSRTLFLTPIYFGAMVYARKWPAMLDASASWKIRLLPNELAKIIDVFNVDGNRQQLKFGVDALCIDPGRRAWDIGDLTR